MRSGTEENRFVVDWRVGVGVEERSGADVWKAVAVATTAASSVASRRRRWIIIVVVGSLEIDERVQRSSQSFGEVADMVQRGGGVVHIFCSTRQKFRCHPVWRGIVKEMRGEMMRGEEGQTPNMPTWLGRLRSGHTSSLKIP